MPDASVGRGVGALRSRQHRLYFFPLPHGQGSFRPMAVTATVCPNILRAGKPAHAGESVVGLILRERMSFVFIGSSTAAPKRKAAPSV